MRADGIIQFYVYDGSTWIEQTDGLLSANIIRGVQQYQGPYAQPETGQMTIVSRNPNLDPYVNANIRYNNYIRINANGQRIFTGRIDGVDVQYQPKENPIITLVAVDMIGTMQKHVLSENFIKSRYSTWNTLNLLNDLYNTQEIDGFLNFVAIQDGTSTSTGGININTPAWAALSVRAATDLGFCYANCRDEIEYYRVSIAHPQHPTNSRPVKASFKYDGSALSYKAINLNDGFENITNQLSINGAFGSWMTGNFVSSDVTVQEESQTSIDLWGKSQLTLNLATNDTNKIADISDAIFTEVSNPVREVYEISWDGLNDPETAKSIDILDNIYIDHYIKEDFSISRKYGVVGIKHEITNNSWYITYTVKNWNFKDSAMPTPTISVSPTTGDQFTDWTFSYTIDRPQEVASVFWDLGEGFTSTSPSPTVNYVNPGVKNVLLTTTNIYGWQKTTQFQLTVGASPPINSFTYSLGTFNVYQFTFTGQEAASYLWDFGDGTTSTLQNPTKYYTVAGQRIVKCTATNAYGSSISTQTFTPTLVTIVPVRYVRVSMQDVNISYGDYLNPANAKEIKKIIVTSTANGNVALDKNIIDTIEYKGFYAPGKTTKDSYGRLTRLAPSLLGQYLLNSSELENIYFYQNDSTSYASPDAMFTIDLGQHYFDITNISLVKNNLGSGSLQFEVSEDNINWFYAGYIYPATAGTTVNLVPSNTLPILTSYGTSSLKPTTYKKVKYAKFVSNGTAFGVNEIVATEDTVMMNSTSFWTTPMFGLGSLNASDETGQKVYLGPNSAPVTLYLNGINKGTVGAGANLGSRLNYKDKTTHIAWDAGDPVEIIVEFNKAYEKVKGFYIDTRNSAGTILSTSSNAFDIYVSEDGTNWDFIDSITLGNLNSTNTGGFSFVNTISSRRTPFLTSGNSISKTNLPLSNMMP